MNIQTKMWKKKTKVSDLERKTLSPTFRVRGRQTKRRNNNNPIGICESANETFNYLPFLV